MNTNNNKKKSNFFKKTGSIIIAVFAIYLTIGMLLGCLPGYIEESLKGSPLIVGIVIGLQSLATLVFRAYSGKMTDTKGAKQGFGKGLLLVLLTAIVYLFASGFQQSIGMAIVLICLARILHGMAESLIVTGGLTWAIERTGVQQSGKVMTWNGIAMYGGIAIGAPLAIALQTWSGIGVVFWMMICLALLSHLLTFRQKGPVVATGFVRIPFYKVVGQVSTQGLGLAFSSIGFACISSFITLLYSDHGWKDVSVAFAGFGGAYILTRIFFAHLPDKFGGYKIAVFSLAIETIGQALIGSAFSQNWVMVGCLLSGVGFSLIFPALGVLAIRNVPAQMRGTALGAFAAFFDLSLAVAGPVAGLMAAAWGYASIYYFGACCSLVALRIIMAGGDKSPRPSLAVTGTDRAPDEKMLLREEAVEANAG